MAGTDAGPAIERVRGIGRSRVALCAASPPPAGAVVVLRERGSAEVRRVAIAEPSRNRAGEAITVIDLSAPWPLASWAGTWDVALDPAGDNTAPALPLAAALDGDAPRSATARDDHLACTVRPLAGDGGGLVLEVRALPEIDRVDLAEDGALTVAGHLAAEGDAALVLRSRSTRERVTAAAALGEGAFDAVLDARALVRDGAGDEEIWDVSVAHGGEDLRIGARLLGEGDPRMALVFPERRLPGAGAERFVRPYVTPYGNLSVRCAVTPHLTDPGPAPKRSDDPRLRRLALRPVVGLLRAARAAAFGVLGGTLGARRRPRGAPGDRPAVAFLLLNAYGMGGTIRTVLATAGHLARTCDVEVLSVMRRRERAFFEIPDGVRVTVVEDQRADVPRTRLQRALGALPSVLMHEGDYGWKGCSLWTDIRLVRALRRLDADVLVGTRPALNVIAARLAPGGVATVGQEHMNFHAHLAGLTRELRRSYPRLDALTVLTEADRRDYARVLAGGRTRVTLIPNAVPELDGGLSSLEAPVVVAAGRLTRQKGFDLLLDAWARVVPQRPGWTLRIYGNGSERARLQWRMLELGIHNEVRFMGPARRLGRALARGSVFALSSRFEGFGMVVLEAMSKGLAVVSFDCPRGPGEIITDGVDGVLVPPADVAALSDALLEVTGDAARRRRLAEAGIRTARRYEPAVVGRSWDALVSDLVAAGGAR